MANRRMDGKERTQKTVYVDLDLIRQVKEKGLDINYSDLFENALRQRIEDLSGDDLAIKMKREIEEKEQKIQELQEEKEKIQKQAKKEFGMDLDDYIDEQNPVSRREKNMEELIREMSDRWKDRIPNNGEIIEFEKPMGGHFRGDLEDYSRYFAREIYDVKLADSYGYSGIQAENFVKDAFKKFQNGEFEDN